jgi:hypothetical protein
VGGELVMDVDRNECVVVATVVVVVVVVDDY